MGVSIFAIEPFWTIALLRQKKCYGFLQWLMNMCYCKNWICCCLLRSSISPKRIKLESCGCAQKKRLEILFPDLIKFLSFQWGGVEKIWDQKCAFFLKQFDVSFTLTHWWKSRIWSKTANRSVSRPIFLDSARPRASKLLLSKLF